MVEYAIGVPAPGGAELLEWRGIAAPEPGPGEARVRDAVIGLSSFDVYHRSGLYLWSAARDLVPGSEAAGVVEEVGEGVSGVAPGDRVPVPRSDQAPARGTMSRLVAFSTTA